jgi:hypothetical protein
MLEQVEELAAGRDQRPLHLVCQGRQVVEGEHGGDGDREAVGGDDERLRDAGGDGAEAAGAGLGDALKGADDADDGTEEADEGGDGARRCDRAESAAETGAEVVELAGEGAAGELRGGEFAWPCRDEGGEAGGEELGQTGCLVRTAKRERLIEGTGRQLWSNRCREGGCPPPLRAEVPDAFNEDANRRDSKGCKEKDHSLGNRAHRGPDVNERKLHGHCLRLKGKRRFLNTAMVLPL